MPEPTQTAGTANSPTGYGWCAWHQGFARGVRLIDVIEHSSGPGTAGRHFACRPCRESYGLVPLADRPMPRPEVDAT
ncbi:hypothetical protein OG246_09585 [Streptomyces sp. NBC_00620]|nr:hypothetical protein [Streptomyces sp. NBC_00620]